MMKISTSLVVAFSLFAFAGCKKKKEEGTNQPAPTDPGSAAMKPTEPPPPPPPKPMTGPELAEQYKKCGVLLNEGKADDFKKECVDEKWVGHMPGMPDTQGPDQLMTMMKDMKAAFPDMKSQPQLVIVNGRNIYAVGLHSGTHTGPMKMPGQPEVPATNKKVGALFFHKLAINDANKATEEWSFMDQGTMMAQLGLAPKGSQPKRPAMDKGLEGAPITVVAADDAKEKANLEAYKKSIDAINAKKLPDSMAIYADDAIDSDQSNDKDVKGKKAIEAAMKTWFGGFSDAKLTDVNAVAAGDYVVAIGKFDGTHDKDIGKLKKTGKHVTLDFAEIVAFKDGKVKQVWRFTDSFQFATQLGLVPAPGTAPGAPAAGSAAPAGKDAKAPAGKDAKAPKKAPEKKADPAAGGEPPKTE